MTTISDDLVIGGALSAANFAFGQVVINTSENEVSSEEVAGLNLKGTGQVSVLLSAETPYPWSRVREVSHQFSGQSGFTVFILRTDATDTLVNYLAWQQGFTS